MATYKVIQDIEAEDKFVGPLTLKQFVFAMGGSLFAYLSFFVLTKGITWGLAITLPPAVFGFFMAIPWSSEQPTDVWVLAKIRFRIKPRKRIWDQSGMQELVKITAPKKMEKQLTKNLSQAEVKSRLRALADTIDSRGWVIKNVSLQDSAGLVDEASDRLINPAALPQQVSELADPTIPDMMEEGHGLDSMIEEHDQIRKAQLYEKMDRVRRGEPLESIDQPEPLVSPPDGNAMDEQALSASLKAKRQAGDIGQGNMHSIPASQPAALISAADGQDDGNASPNPAPTGVEKAQASMTEPSVPDILDLARNNDLNVSTIARQAKADEPKEVIISLH